MAKKKKKISKRMQNEILALLKRTPGVPVNRKEISRQLNIHKSDFYIFMDSLIDLVKAGKIVHARKQHYAFAPKQQTMIGELRTTRAGYGFVLVEGQEMDVFVAQPNLNTAFDRDIVEIQLYANSRGKRLEGFVRKVVKRFREQIVGTLHVTPYYNFVVPDDPKVYRDILIRPDESIKAEDGQKVVVRFEKWEKNQHNPEGTLTEILGRPGDPGVDIISVAYSFNLPVHFSEKIEQEAARVRGGITEKDLAGREDLRALTCFTIDPIDAKDFDDAISMERKDNGNWELGVHIADVSHYVAKDTVLDKEALRRGTSVYLVDRVIPMLPERLSNELCSLKPHVDRLAFSCIMEVNEQAEVMDYRIFPSIINSKRRFNYEEVQQIIDGQIQDTLAPVLRDMDTMRERLSRKRFQNGGIDFETPEVRFVLDEKGNPVEIIPKQRLNSHRLVEEFMLLANQTVARHIRRISPHKNRPLPFLYRVHEKPNEEKMNRFFGFLAALQIPYKPVKKVTSKYFQNLLRSIKGTKEEIVIEEVALRSMMKAVYSEKNIGHFGLGFRDYTHFTSPIRRYPDLTVHRLLKQYADDPNRSVQGEIKKLKAIADQSNKMERLAVEAERESVKLKQVEYISKYIGESYKGLVSGVMSFGIFVELEKIFVEGIIPLTEMKDDFYIYDEKTYSMIGRDTDQTIRLGDEVVVRVEGVDAEKKRVEFSLIENLSDEPGRSQIRIEQYDNGNKKPRKRRKR